MKRRLVALACLTALLLPACNGGSDEDDQGREPQPTPTEAESEPTEPTDPTSQYPPEQVEVLDNALTDAYEGAAEYSSSNDNYFARNTKEKGELAAAVSVALSRADTGAGSGYVEEDELGLCSRYDDAPMVRINVSEDGDDLVLAASDQEIVIRLTYTAGEAPVFSEPEPCE